MEVLKVGTTGPQLTVDARAGLPEEGCPGRQIFTLIEDALPGTVCEIHLPQQKAVIIKAKLEGMGHRVAVAELEPGHYRLRLVKM